LAEVALDAGQLDFSNVRSGTDRTAGQGRTGTVNDETRNRPILLKNSKMDPLQFLAKLNRERQFAL
jgi:hypothetical protein